jgi:hypothetical protein
VTVIDSQGRHTQQKIMLAKNVEKGASGSAELGATQSTNNSVKADAVKTFSAAGRAGNIR